MKEPNNQALRAENEQLRADIRNIQRNTAEYRQDARKEADAAIQRAVQADKRAADFAEANRRMLAMIETPTDRHAEGRLAGLEEAAKVAEREAGIIALAEGHDDEEARSDRWYPGARHAAKTIFTAIRAIAKAGQSSPVASNLEGQKP